MVKYLHHLDVSHNSLKAIPDEICCLGYALDTLKLSHNEIARLPDDLHKLRKLRVLEVACNQMEFMPQGTAQLHSVTTISVSGNKLK